MKESGPLGSLHSDAAELRRLRERLERAEAALRRLHVLARYGIDLQGPHDFDQWLAWASSNDEIERWFGEPLQSYIVEALAACGAVST